MRLDCGVYGEGTVFSVDVSAGAHVSSLQEAIAGIVSSPECVIAPRLLTLYVAQTGSGWLKSDSTLEEFLKAGRRSEPVEFLKMIPNYRLDDELYFGKGFAPGDKEIHVIVGLPEPPVGSRAWINAMLFARKKKRAIHAIDELASEHREQLKKKMRFSEVYTAVREPTPPPEEQVPRYTWLEAPDHSDEQRANYISYLETHFKPEIEGEDLCWVDGAGHTKMLSVVDSRLPFGLRGTADVLLVDQRSIRHHEPLAGIQMVVGLKRTIEQDHKVQAMGALIAASLKAPLDCTPMGLLTDLRDHWYFSWFNEEKVLAHVRLEHPKNALEFMAAAVGQPDSFRVPFMRFPLEKYRIDDFLPLTEKEEEEEEEEKGMKLMHRAVSVLASMAGIVHAAGHCVGAPE